MKCNLTQFLISYLALGITFSTLAQDHSINRAPVGEKIVPPIYQGSPEVQTLGYGGDGNSNTWNSINAVTGAITLIGPINSLHQGGDFDGTGVFYATRAPSTLIKVDPLTGVETVVSSITGITFGHTITSMGWNEANSTMYIGSTDITTSELYTLNLITGAATFVGVIGQAGLIAIAINCDGDIYSVDIVDDNLWSINAATGAGTIIGPLGFNANFAQDADFDPVTGILYLTAFINDDSTGQYRVANLTTGATTLLMDWGAIEISSYGIQGSCSGDLNEVRIFLDDFEDGTLANWTVTNDGGDCVWSARHISANDYDLPQTAGGFLLSADSDLCGEGTSVLSTATLDFITDATQSPGYQEVRIEWDNDWQVNSVNDEAYVEYSLDGGTNWSTVISWIGVNQINTHEVWSIPGAGLQSDIRFRFRAIQPSWDWWWAIDNFSVYLAGSLSAAPTAITNPASNIGDTSATLNGSVNPNNSQTTVEFEYGLTTSYGTVVTANQSPINGTTAVSVSANITGLSTNTTYHFRVKATNSAGTTVASDQEFATSFNYPSTYTLNSTYTFGNVTQSSSYKMLGLPGNNNLLLDDIIPGNPGKDNDWRAFWDSGSGVFDEYDGTSKFNITPGRAFWVLSKNQIVINRIVNTVNLDQDNSYSIPLHTEWNLISNPFDKNISWDDVKNANPGVNQPIHYFSSGYVTPAPNLLEPYKGYYFFNDMALSTLKIPYVTQGGNNLLNKKESSANSIDIILTSDGIGITKVKAGISETAHNSLDELDRFSPPDRFAEINLAIYNDELETNYKFLKEDYRTEIINGEEFDLMIKNETAKGLKLRIENITDYFESYEVYLIDNRLHNIFNLKETREIDINRIHKQNKYSLLIGTKHFIQHKTSELLPIEYSLYQNYPNPFNPKTVIRFGVPKESIVTIKVYNMLGELVVELIDDQRFQAGYYEVDFNATGLPSGVYFYQLRAADFVQVKKMLLLK
ncbi:MAG: T9SS type A sorting domain-containing protein [Candidatus Kariarchaeaceae archaeon]|jgi:hypothetical protein